MQNRTSLNTDDDDENNNLNEKSILNRQNPTKANTNLSYGLNQQREQSQQQQLYSSELLNAINDRRSKLQQNLAVYLLLAINGLERFAYYGLICNYVLYLNKKPLYWESYNAIIVLFIFLGITQVSSVVGGWIADSLLGKFTTICLSFVLYIIGYAAFPLLAFNETYLPNYCNANSSMIDWSFVNYSYIHRFKDNDRTIAHEACSWVVLITVVLISISVGFIKANLGPFGADQVISRGQTMVFKYFNWLYWSINLGSLISFVLLAYIQQNFNFFIGYLIPLCALVVSFILLLSGLISFFFRFFFKLVFDDFYF